MATLRLLLTFSDGSSVGAELSALWPSDDVIVKYNGEAGRLPKELRFDRDRPNSIEYHWKQYAAKTGAQMTAELVGEWLPEDDVKSTGDVRDN